MTTTNESDHYKPGDLVKTFRDWPFWKVSKDSMGIVVDVERHKIYPYRVFFCDTNVTANFDFLELYPVQKVK